MEYIYSAMLLHSAGKEITNENNILANLTEVAEGYESVPDDIWNAYDYLSKMEYVEVIYKLSEGLILKK